ncbi:MFS transporter [Micrococcaceae bacterium Sec5.7]
MISQGPSTTVAAPPPRAQEAPRRGRAGGLVATLILSVVAFQLNASMLSPALPDIAESLGENLDQIAQVSALFFLAGAVSSVILGRWSDVIGRRNTLLIVLGLLTVGTLLCIWAPNLTVLLIGRVLQGASSATFPLAYTILSKSLSAKAFGTALGLITAVNGGVGGADGYIGGLLADTLGFRSIFVGILAVTLIALPCVFLVVPKDAVDDAAGGMDWWGAAALSMALICITFFVSQGPTSGWLAPITLVYLAGTVVSLLLFGLIQKKSRNPLIAIHHLRSRQMWPLLATTILTLTGIFAVMNFTVVLLGQDSSAGYGLGAATSALLLLTPPALIGVFAAPISGWFAGRRGWLKLLRAGLLISVLALVLIASVPLDRWVVAAALAVLGVSYYGMVLTALGGISVVLSPEDAPAALPAVNGACFGIGAGLGIGIVAPFAALGTVDGYSTALWISVGITALALVASFIISPRPGQKL